MPKTSTFLMILLVITSVISSQRDAYASASDVERLQGTVEDLDQDLRSFYLSNEAGSKKKFVYNTDTLFLAGEEIVNEGYIKNGLVIDITFEERQNSDAAPPGLAMISYLATKIVIDPSLAQGTAPTLVRFVDFPAGMLIDRETHLMWQKGDSKKEITFGAAQKYCSSLRLGGYVDWRLPESNEHDDPVVVALATDKRSDGPADWFWPNNSAMWVPFNYPAGQMFLSTAVGISDGAAAYARCVRNWDSDDEPSIQKLTVYQAQVKLTQLGFEPGTPDGLMGTRTQNALRQFQQKYGIEVTGKLDDETKSRLGLNGGL